MHFLFFLSITLKTLGEEDLQVLGCISSLIELHIQVEKPTQGRDKRLTIGTGYAFQGLTRFSVKSDSMELRFARGAMQNLHTLRIDLGDVQDTLLQFGDFVLGLENLSFLEHIYVEFHKSEYSEQEQCVRNTVEKEISMNRNNPILEFRGAAEREVTNLSMALLMLARRSELGGMRTVRNAVEKEPRLRCYHRQKRAGAK